MRIWPHLTKNPLPACFLLCASICSAQLPTPPPVVQENTAGEQTALPRYLLDHTIGATVLPDAPLPSKEKVGFWTFANWDDAPLRSNRQVFHDKTWIAVQSVHLAAIVYDVELAHQGIAHHKCVDKGDDPYPSRAQLYRGHIPEYAFGTFFNILMMKYVSKPFIFEFSGYATYSHVRTGSRWLTNCW